MGGDLWVHQFSGLVQRSDNISITEKLDQARNRRDDCSSGPEQQVDVGRNACQKEGVRWVSYGPPS